MTRLAPPRRAQPLGRESQRAAKAPVPSLPADPHPMTPQPVLAPETLSARSPRIVRRLGDFARLMRLDRPIGIWLLLWPEMWALWIAAGGHPQRRLLAIFGAGTLLMRSAGCIINDFWDRNIDPHVKRTRARPLAARVLGPYEALTVFALLVLAAGLLVLQLNAYTLRLALVGLALTISYPLFK